MERPVRPPLDTREALAREIKRRYKITATLPKIMDTIEL